MFRGLVVGLILALAGPAVAEDYDETTARFELSDELDPIYTGIGFSVSPVSDSVILGGEVLWQNSGTLPHVLVEENGFFRWGPIPPGDEERFIPWAAGTYSFHDALEPLLDGVGYWEVGRFTVRPEWERRRGFFGARGTLVRWASQRAPEGFLYDVQVSEGSFSDQWKWWRKGVREPSGRYVVRGPIDTYAGFCLGFRARLRDADEPDLHLDWGESLGVCVIA